jgi:hypothetical protein
MAVTAGNSTTLENRTGRWSGVYQVLSRGNERRAIVRDDADRQRRLDWLQGSLKMADFAANCPHPAPLRGTPGTRLRVRERGDFSDSL